MSVTRTTRQGMASGVSSTDPLYGLYASETVWATQTNRLRQQFYAAEGSAATGYNTAWRTATNQLRSSLMTDEIACSNAGFEAYKTLSQDLTGASTNYTLATYDAESSRFLAQISIESAKSYADASSRAALSRERADAFSEALADVLDEFDAAGFENQTTLDALIGTGVTNGSAYATLAASILSDVDDIIDSDETFCLATYGAVPGTGEEPETYPTTTRLGAALAQNQQTYDAALAAVAAEYREDLRVAENDWRLAALDAYADEETSLTTALLARKSGLANDYGTYLTALSVAATQYSDRVNLNDQVYSYHQERIDHFNATVALSGIFTNPTFDYEVCFVAGTPVLMADGSRRAIETLRPGDLVLAADQLNPESTPAPAKVVRFFDNGEKTVVRLRFEGQELVCTPEHPFYVLGKGWVRAEELVEGDLCLNAKGGNVAFISREELAEKRRVYNIEVEGAHTYFVGDDDGVLAHNECSHELCPLCHGSGKLRQLRTVYNGVNYHSNEEEYDCYCCVNDIPNEFFERLCIVGKSRNVFDSAFDDVKDFCAVQSFPSKSEIEELKNNFNLETMTTEELFKRFLAGIWTSETFSYVHFDNKGNLKQDSVDALVFRKGRLLDELMRSDYINRARQSVLLDLARHPDVMTILGFRRNLYKDPINSGLDFFGGAINVFNGTKDYSLSLFLGSYELTVQTRLAGSSVFLTYTVANEVSYRSFRRSLSGKGNVQSYDEGYMGTMPVFFTWTEEIPLSEVFWFISAMLPKTAKK